VSWLAPIVPAPPGWSIDWPAITHALADLITPAELAATPQDAGYHAEGDVWIHTRMVVDALVTDDDWRALAPDARAIAFAAALLHDVGKPSTTRTEPDGRISSRGHSRRGDHLVRTWLWRAGAPFAEREQICRLVRCHQVPFFEFSAPDAAHRVERRALAMRNDLLTLVALADARGRRCAIPGDRDRLIEQCELYRELCRDRDVLAAPRSYASAHTRMVWIESEGRRPADLLAHDDTTGTVVILSGLPACGKDTWLARHQPGLPVVSLDAIREAQDIDGADDQGPVIAAARDQARGHLRAGRSFAWNATNVSERLRAQLIAFMRAYRARVHLVYCEVPADEQARRNRARRDPVPAAAIAKMIERWTVPWPDLAHEVTYAVPEPAATAPAPRAP
jgi:predicted kinase